jgi:hypothetical protein
MPIMRAEYKNAFADISARLISRFGGRGHVRVVVGRVIERTVDDSR